MNSIIDEIVCQIKKDYEQKSEYLLIDDIIDIYNGKYIDYEDYYIRKTEEADALRKLNMRMSCLQTKYTYYIEPIILSELLFSYIQLLKEGENNAGK